ncbi:Major Facilitator Superfamily protein [Pseudogulbenkiania subflava DSM 22618]|uniref:Major Facilitator Superfamily protein n=2 Tax=Pseudogulbenkiania subflava TaxID=451637 RepID=A0A1Y6CBQ0_9NEIS|nr:Major Facilitator Superfamily protein [Pseudogulbenkiania subflava DSM 22618]
MIVRPLPIMGFCLAVAGAAMPPASLIAPRYSLHHVAIAVIVLLEYLQSVMVAFGSAAIRHGVQASPQQFSLAAAGYAAVAVLMILSHRWWVQRLGYRTLLRLSLWVFGAGAVLCALSPNAGGFIAARMVQALGGAAFFTASRVQILHHQGPARLPALLFLPLGIMLGSGLAPILAGALLAAFDWRALFWAMLPLVWLVDRVVRHAVPEHEPVENERPDQAHPWGMLLLVGGVFLLQFVLERARFESWTRAPLLWGAGLLALTLLALHWRHEWHRPTPLVPYRHFTSERYLWGMAVYGFGYLVVSSCSYVLPLFLAEGLGLSLAQCGWLLGLTGLAAMPFAVLHLKLMLRWPHLRRFLLVGTLLLAAFAGLMARQQPAATGWPLWLAVFLLNGVFMPFLLGTAAASTFSQVEERVFSHAYQVKNAMREVANAVGLLLGTGLLQQRSALHAAREPELASGQLVLLAGQDFFWALLLVALAVGLLLQLQRRFV